MLHVHTDAYPYKGTRGLIYVKSCLLFDTWACKNLLTRGHAIKVNKRGRTVSNITFTIAIPGEVSSEGKCVKTAGLRFLDHILHKSTVLPHIELKHLRTGMPA